MIFAEGLYRGEVVHARLRPVSHKLSYKVFSLLVDVDRLDALEKRLTLFGHNKRALVSVRDADHGDGGPLKDWLDGLANQAGEGGLSRYLMLTYPRILGYGFNPITVYYGLDAGDRPRLMIYQVNNTFGQRQTYVLPVGDARPDGLISQSCAKSFYVSPFNNVEGEYLFHVTPPADEITVGVALKTEEGALLRAHFRGHHQPLTDGTLLKALLAYGWLGINVMAGIHWEALKLWLKGLKLKPRPDAPKRHVEVHSSALRHPAE